jgi:uncharacterized protein YnzC (UPF0291/DUF896 family)
MNFTERQALEITLKSLLEQRVNLRKQYVDQDKAIGREIKETLKRIRELDEKGTALEVIPNELNTNPMEVSQQETGRVRKQYTRHAYEELAQIIKEILAESQQPISLQNLTEILKQSHGIEFSNPYLGINKAVNHVQGITSFKDGRKLYFQLNCNEQQPVEEDKSDEEMDGN